MLGAELVERQKLVEPQNKIEHNQADNGPKQNHFLHDGVSCCLWPNRCTAADTADGNERLLYVSAYRTARIYRKHGYIACIKNAPLTIRVRHRNCCPAQRCNRNSDQPHEFHRPLGHVEAGRADGACWHVAEATSASG